MKTTKNKAFGKNKFYNFYINKKENEYFFIFPVVGFSNSKNISWDIKMSSFFIAWGRSFIQLNLFEVVKDSNLDVSSNIVAQLEKVLITMKLKIIDKEETGEFYPKIFFGDNINVTAIVGENGSGKSSIFEIIKRVSPSKIVPSPVKYIKAVAETQIKVKIKRKIGTSIKKIESQVLLLVTD